MTPVFLSDSVWLHFGTSSASTGAATNADSTPTVTIAEDGTDMGYAPSVSNVATGLYKVQIDATSGNGFEAGKRYSAYVAATVGGIAGRDGIGEFEVLAVDLNTGVASVTGAVGSVTGNVGGSVTGSVGSVVGLTAANLDVAVSTRLATAGYTAPDNATVALIAGYTDSIEARLPAALIGGRIDATVGAMQADVVTAASIAAGAIGASEAPLLANLDVAVSTRATAGDAMTLTAGAVDTIWDEVIAGGYTVRQLLRGFASALMAKLSGAEALAPVFRDVGDTKDVITATTDANGNRTAVTLDLT